MTFEFLRFPLDTPLEQVADELEHAMDRVGGGRWATVLGLDGFGEAIQVYVSDTAPGDRELAPLAHYFHGPSESPRPSDVLLPEGLAGDSD